MPQRNEFSTRENRVSDLNALFGADWDGLRSALEEGTRDLDSMDAWPGSQFEWLCAPAC